MESGFRGPAGAGSGHQDISGALTAVLVRYVRQHSGDSGVLQMLAVAGSHRSAGELEDVTSWSSYEEAVSLLHAGAQVTGDGSIGLHVGEEMLRQHTGTPVADQLRSLGSPAALLEHTVPAIDRFVRVTSTEVLEHGSTYAVLRAVTGRATTRHPHLCDFTRGLLTQVPVVFGLPPATVTESECQARGGRFCLYSVTWEAAASQPPEVETAPSLIEAAWESSEASRARADVPTAAAPAPVVVPAAAAPPPAAPPPAAPPGPELGGSGTARPTSSASGLVLDAETRIAQLSSQLDQMTERLEGVFSTAAELLGEEDIDTLLASITSRAARAVSAPKYLLVVRTSPEAPIQLHHHGFDDDEAQVLANELWRDIPDDGDGSRLIVDIASSRRRYGRLAAVFPPGVRYFESERRMLALYAGYAATALDVVTALEEARASDATRRALLDFSGALARLTSTDAVAQLLADSATSVLGCDHATVMLWDGARSELVVHARTAGRQPPKTTFGTRRDTTGGEASSGVAPDDRATATGEPTRSGVVLRSEDTPLVRHVIDTRSIIVIDRATQDPFLHEVLLQTDTEASVIAPLVAADEFLGVVAANFTKPLPPSVARGRDLHERLSGLADQAATSLQNARLLERISHMAWHDVLTGLPNRRLLEDRVRQELARARRAGEGLCMFFIDLDQFKNVNDTMGHATGDELIRQVGQRLCETVRRQDTVARLGGDEFAVLLPGLSDRDAVEHLARRSLEVLHAPYDVFGREVRASGSIGVALAPQHGTTYDELLNHADEAMYRSKALGRDTFHLYTEAEVSANEGADLESELRSALERSEFFLLYQPYIDLKTTQVVGVEALVRWRHPRHGVLEPQAFIPVAESSNLIVALDTWVLEEACQQVRRWADDGLPPLRLSVNLASRDLANPELFENVRRSLAGSRLDPSLLELEITQRVVLDETGVAPRNIEQLRRLGVRFSIDDFGTGNSSMSRIGTFPVSTLKIDESFVQVLGPEAESSTLVAAIISMAHRLGLDVVAEGVETSNQSRVLLQRGCTTAQGFFFSPPLLPGDVERMLEGENALAGRTGTGTNGMAS